MVAALVTGLAIVPSAVTAAPNDNQLGGPAGDASAVADDTLCPDGEVVTGVVGSNDPNWVITQATVQCTNGAAATGTMGTHQSSITGSTTCAAGEVAVGIAGNEGDFIDVLSVRCQSADGTGPITTATGFGGGGGAPDGPYDCPAGSALTGLKGESVFDGAVVRYVEIVCGSIAPPDLDGDGIADTAPPTTKDQCKDGGWATFNNPSFKNQGLCVAYVVSS